jgi:Lysylphosphatidylglycerol synthase TM region
MMMPDDADTARLRTPSTSDRGSAPRPSGLRLALQLTGFALGIGLLVWFIRDVLRPANRPNLERLLSASTLDVALLLGLSVLLVVISGATFRQVLRPVHRLPWWGSQATNVIACLLALLPFKVSIMFRVLMHNRRDGVPLLTIGAWFLIMSVVIMGAIAPVLVVNSVHPRVDLMWFMGAIGGVAAVYTALVASAKFAASAGGWCVVERIWHALPMPGFIRRSTILDRAHEGVRMAADARSLAIVAVLRFTELAIQTARVIVAARIVGQELSLDTAVLSGTVYFLIGAAAPTGQLGTREQGTSKLVASVAPGLELGPLQTIILSISLAELIVLIVGSSIGMGVLKPWRSGRTPAGTGVNA